MCVWERGRGRERYISREAWFGKEEGGWVGLWIIMSIGFVVSFGSNGGVGCLSVRCRRRGSVKMGLSRREFLVATGTSLASLLLPEVRPVWSEPSVEYALPKLPYPYDALEPFIDEATMKLHHDKHFKAYLDKFNAVLPNVKNITEPTTRQLELALESERTLPSSLQKTTPTTMFPTFPPTLPRPLFQKKKRKGTLILSTPKAPKNSKKYPTPNRPKKQKHRSRRHFRPERSSYGP